MFSTHDPSIQISKGHLQLSAYSGRQGATQG